MATPPAEKSSVETEIKQTMHLLTSYILRPQGVTYVDQDEDEEIILFLRRSLITNLPWVTMGGIALLIPPLIAFAMPFLPSAIVLPEIDSRYILVGIVFYYLLISGYLLSNFLVWFYNLSIVTNKKMVDIDYFNLRSKNVASAPLEAIEEVEFTQSSFLQGFFDYGDVVAQTQAEIPNFDFSDVPHPAKVVDIVTDVIPERGGGK